MTIVEPQDRAAYAGERLVHDADAHIVETDGFYEAYADPAVRERLARFPTGSRGRDLAASIERLRATHHRGPRAARRPARSCCTRTSRRSARSIRPTASSPSTTSGSGASSSSRARTS